MKCLKVNPNPLEELLLLNCELEPLLLSITICLWDFTANKAAFESPLYPTTGPAAFKETGPNELSRLEEQEVPEFPPK
jgi:hypothetical protein